MEVAPPRLKKLLGAGAVVVDAGVDALSLSSDLPKSPPPNKPPLGGTAGAAGVLPAGFAPNKPPAGAGAEAEPSIKLSIVRS